MLWGQLHLLPEGSMSKDHDSPDTISPLEKSGTILCRGFNYRVKARKGKYKIYSRQGGYLYLIVHEGHREEEIYERIEKVGFSMSNDHEDKDVVYINRYDWSCAAGDEEDAGVKLGLDTQTIETYAGGCLFLLDAGKLPSLVEKIKGETLEKNTVLKDKDGSYGVFLRDEDENYELGWIVFQEGEMVAFAYDPQHGAWITEPM